jgi:hypothetical protein
MGNLRSLNAKIHRTGADAQVQRGYLTVSGVLQEQTPDWSEVAAIVLA